ncbi:hypothetical protein yc1106_04385 [Curvularia clavata]|uniref:Uncharacterized protein n=1 Tax=Curvularia clavata TaxID=95742 RepID=A0A9Q8Z680_CURCL|nr:hypothetical protein yc1106_04385 [Curvularia clavata]
MTRSGLPGTISADRKLHGVHVNETLKVAARSLSSIRQRHEISRVEIDLFGNMKSVDAETQSENISSSSCDFRMGWLNDLKRRAKLRR